MNKKLFLLIPACLLVLAACTPKQGGSGAGSSGETSGDTSSGGSSSEREHVNYGSAEAPLNLATLVQEVSKLGLADYEYSPQHFFVRATVAQTTAKSEGRFEFRWTEGELSMLLSNISPEEGKTMEDYMPGDVAVIKGYVRYRVSGQEPTGYYMTYNSTEGVANPAPSVVSNQEATRPAVTGIEVDSDAAVNLRQGDTKQLTATISPRYARGTVQWSVERLNDAAEGKLTCVNGLVTAAEDATVGNQYKVIAAVADTTFKAEVTFTITSNAAPRVETKLVKYDFTSYTDGTGSEYNDTTLLAAFGKARVGEDATVVTAASGISKVYDQYQGFKETYVYYKYGMKFGTGKANGTFTLTTSKDITKVIVVAAGWTADDTLSIGGAAAQTIGTAAGGPTGGPADKAPAEGIFKTLTFEFDATKSVSLEFAKRGYIQSFEFYGYND